MTTSYFPQQDDWYAGDWIEEDAYFPDPPLPRRVIPVDVFLLILVVLVLVAMIAGLSRFAVARPVAMTQPVVQVQETTVDEPWAPLTPPVIDLSVDAFAMPYADYWLTQGPHGSSYGHFAIDIAAGKDEPILSPINGHVSQRYLDGIGNPTLVIANERYDVTMMHGNYSVQIGQELVIGDQVGRESNQGNTRDMAGNSCRNRDCGYHTHLNVYDKQAGRNINPLELLP